MYPCLRRVQCGYCGKEMMKKNLAKHTKAVHKSSLVKEVPLKNSEIGFNGRLKAPTTLQNPGTAADPCACPAGFSRCAGRCLKRLNLAVNYDEAQSQCAALGAHLAVPRSDEENQCAIDAAGANIVWLGFNDVITENQFVADDGCGTVPSDGPSWAVGQPNNNMGQSHGALIPPDAITTWFVGWHDVLPTELLKPLCQLDLCHQSRCQ